MLFVLVFQRASLHEGEVQFMLCVFISIKQRVFLNFHALQERLSRGIRPPTTPLLLGTLADMTRGKSELLAEKALLRHQLIILRRQMRG
jgi:putative transposase